MFRLPETPDTATDLSNVLQHNSCCENYPSSARSYTVQIILYDFILPLPRISDPMKLYFLEEERFKCFEYAYFWLDLIADYLLFKFQNYYVGQTD